MTPICIQKRRKRKRRGVKREKRKTIELSGSKNNRKGSLEKSLVQVSPGFLNEVKIQLIQRVRLILIMSYKVSDGLDATWNASCHGHFE